MSLRLLRRARIGAIVLLGLMLGNPTFAQSSAASGGVDEADHGPLLQLGPGDSVTVSVYGQPDMTATVYVSDDGTIPIALAGPVQIAGLSPQGAAQRIEKALRDGQFFKEPHVTLAVTQSRSQRVTVLGEVGSPGRYIIDARTSLLDLLAQAGGTKDTADTTVFLLRQDASGNLARYPINLQGINNATASVSTQGLRGGDSILVPKATHYYVNGEVKSPNMYRLEPGLTVIEAIIRAGGLSPRGSKNRVELQRKDAGGKTISRKAKMEDVLQPDDILLVKESIF